MRAMRASPRRAAPSRPYERQSDQTQAEEREGARLRDEGDQVVDAAGPSHRDHDLVELAHGAQIDAVRRPRPRGVEGNAEIRVTDRAVEIPRRDEHAFGFVDDLAVGEFLEIDRERARWKRTESESKCRQRSSSPPRHRLHLSESWHPLTSSVLPREASKRLPLGYVAPKGRVGFSLLKFVFNSARNGLGRIAPRSRKC